MEVPGRRGMRAISVVGILGDEVVWRLSLVGVVSVDLRLESRLSVVGQ